MLSHIKMGWAAEFADVGPLVTRVVVGIIFVVHGRKLFFSYHIRPCCRLQQLGERPGIRSVGP